MNHGSHTPGTTRPHEFPLFGSSWVALFVILRDSLARPAVSATTISPKTGPTDHPH